MVAAAVGMVEDERVVGAAVAMVVVMVDVMMLELVLCTAVVVIELVVVVDKVMMGALMVEVVLDELVVGAAVGVLAVHELFGGRRRGRGGSGHAPESACSFRTLRPRRSYPTLLRTRPHQRKTKRCSDTPLVCKRPQSPLLPRGSSFHRCMSRMTLGPGRLGHILSGSSAG